MEVVEW